MNIWWVITCAAAVGAATAPLAQRAAVVSLRPRSGVDRADQDDEPRLRGGWLAHPLTAAVLFGSMAWAIGPEPELVTMEVDGPGSVFIGEDPPGGGDDLDASEIYTLTITGEPHPEHGYHVKLTIHADGSQGADVKHKVFWVSECEQPTTPPTTSPPTTSPPATTQAPVDPTNTLPGTGLGDAGQFGLLGLAALLAGGLLVGVAARRLRT